MVWVGREHLIPTPCPVEAREGWEARGPVEARKIGGWCFQTALFLNMLCVKEALPLLVWI